MPEASTNPFLEARNAGLSPIPVDTKTKKPLVAWKQYQDHIADIDELTEWQGHNIGVVCGRVSGRLVALDFEGSFVDAGGAAELNRRLSKAGLYETFYSWMEGYSEATPRNGFHCLVHLEGDGPMEGNRKLAFDASGHVIIETRSEGGYVVTAPSTNGASGWRMWRGGFDSIAWTSMGEWAAVLALLTSFDETAPPPPAAPPVAPSILRLSDDWFDDEKATLPPIEQILEEHGWQRAGSSDSYGEHWVRPDKDPREGHSASLSHDARRLWVHSTNAAPLPTEFSLDALDVILCYELGSAPTAKDRTDYIVARRKNRQPATPADGRQAAGQAAETSPAPSSLNLPSTFWNSRKYLSHVRQAALASGVNPDALWEAVKVFFAASVSPGIVIPFKGTLDYIGVMVGKAGAGKTMAKRAALELFPADFREHPRVKLGAPAGSGEGMVEFFIDRSEGTQRIRFDGAGFYVDEGKWLLDVNSRAGNTSVQAIKQAWSGELTGSLAATAERNRWLAAGAVRVGVLIAIQPGIAADFLRSDLTEGGFPQRLSWGWSHPDEVPDELPEHPGFLDVPMWTLDHWGTSYDPRAPRVMTYDAELMQVVVQARRDGLLGKEVHGGHDILAQLKGAALIALMDDRREVSMPDWELAQLDWNTGVQVRNYLLATQQQSITDRDTAAGRSAAVRKIAEVGVYLERAVVALVTKARSSEEPMSSRDVKDHLRHFSKRHGVHYQEVLALAIERGLVHRTAGGAYDAS